METGCVVAAAMATGAGVLPTAEPALLLLLLFAAAVTVAAVGERVSVYVPAAPSVAVDAAAGSTTVNTVVAAAPASPASYIA